MTLLAKVSNGQIILPPDTTLPEGAEVQIEIEIPDQDEGPKPRTLNEIFGDLVGCVEGPEDMAENHNHYAHGAPKRAQR